MTDDASIVIAKPQRRPYLIWCPGCRFDFERTTVATARTWAAEHNAKSHDGLFQIRDLTVRTPAGSDTPTAAAG